MGIGLTWLAIKGGEREKIREYFSFVSKGAIDSYYDASLADTELPTNWYLLTCKGFPYICNEKHLSALSQNADLITCSVEEHVMVSLCTAWKNGKMIWEVMHECEKGPEDLQIKGELPPEFEAVKKAAVLKRQADLAATGEACDHFFDIPPDLALCFTGFEHYKQADFPFEKVKGPGFLRRLFMR